MASQVSCCSITVSANSSALASLTDVIELQPDAITLRKALATSVKRYIFCAKHLEAAPTKTMSNLLDFDFEAAIAQKNQFAKRPAPKRAERPIDIETATLLGEPANPLQDTRLLIVVERANYRAYLSNLMSQLVSEQSGAEQAASTISSADAHILNAATEWKQQLQATAIFSCYSKERYSEVCPLGIRLIGSGLSTEADLIGHPTHLVKKKEKQMLQLIADFCPTHIVTNALNHRILKWANRRRINTVVMLQNGQISLEARQRRTNKAQLKPLSHPQVDWIGSPNLPTCQAIADSGIPAQKVIPWRWSNPYRLDQSLPKTLNRDRIHLFYASATVQPAQTLDLLTALKELAQKSHVATFEISTDRPLPAPVVAQLQQQSKQLAVEDKISLSIPSSAEQLLERVRAADIVLIPEDIPNSAPGEVPLLVEAAMAACTPIVASDRPNLKAHLTHGINATIFPAGNFQSMMHRIERLISQPQLYAQLSQASSSFQAQSALSVTWQELIERWLANGFADRQWLQTYACLPESDLTMSIA